MKVLLSRTVFRLATSIEDFTLAIVFSAHLWVVTLPYHITYSEQRVLDGAHLVANVCVVLAWISGLTSIFSLRSMNKSDVNGATMRERLWFGLSVVINLVVSWVYLTHVRIGATGGPP